MEIKVYNMDSRSFITISIDDGAPQDLKAAELLDRFGLKGTFYIPATNSEHPSLSLDGIRAISKKFEVGGHTFHHQPLTGLSPQKIKSEIQDGKTWLEDVTGTSVKSFCYPQGKFNPRIVQMVKNAGFQGARTCLFNLNNFPQNPYLWGVSTHAYSHSPLIQLRHALLEKNFLGLWNYAKIFRFQKKWADHFATAITHVEKYGGVAHLYFHSWEIHDQGDWKTLEDLLCFASKHKKLIPITNGDLFTLWWIKVQSKDG